MRATISKSTVDALRPGDILYDDKIDGFQCRARNRFKTICSICSRRVD